jgi:hypothetical protein
MINETNNNGHQGNKEYNEQHNNNNNNNQITTDNKVTGVLCVESAMIQSTNVLRK